MNLMKMQKLLERDQYISEQKRRDYYRKLYKQNSSEMNQLDKNYWALRAAERFAEQKEES